MRTKVDSDGIPYIIQDVLSKWPDIFEFKLFDGRMVILTHESVECHLHPLPTKFAHNLVRYNDYKSLNELLGEWVWRKSYRTGLVDMHTPS